MLLLTEPELVVYTMSFKKYQHIERFGTDEVEGIDIGVCYVFPKLDGTNSSIWFRDGTLYAGSRNRVLSLDNDNAGFYNWVIQNEHRFNGYFWENPTHRLYGEWLVPHTLKTYRDEAWRRLWIFDVYDDELGQHIPYDIYNEKLIKHSLDFIIPSHKIKNPHIDQLVKIVEGNTYLIKDGSGPGEGIVIKNYEYRNKYSRQTWAKLVRNEFKEENKKAFGVPEQEGIAAIESVIAEKYVNPVFVAKTRAKIENEGVTERGKLIPRLLQTCYHDLINEEIWNIMKDYKNPVIDFAKLNRFVIHFVKKCASDLF